MTSQRYQFTPSKAFPGLRGGLPFVDISLTHKGQGLHVSGLVDSGSTINVLPYDYGLQLGLDWHSQDLPLQGVGYLEEIPSYAVLLQGQVDPFPPVLLVFMWTRRTSDEISLILGQVNFFEYFRVVFDKTDGFFELTPKY